jgi:hypothetical protein
VLLTRSPLGTTRCCHQMALARLACVRHAASVRPEPGSNSPSEIDRVLPCDRHRRDTGGFALSSGTRWPEGSPRLTMPRIAPGHRCCWLIRCPDVPFRTVVGAGAGRARTHPRPPHIDGVQSTDFSHTVEFSRSLVGSLLATPPGGSRSGPVAGAAATLPGPSKVRQASDLSPLESQGLPPFSLAARTEPRRTQRWVVPGYSRGPATHPTCFPRDPATSGRRSSAVTRSVDSEPFPSRTTWSPWRHLAISTSHRRAVPRPAPLGRQDGHRSRRICNPLGSR